MLYNEGMAATQGRRMTAETAVFGGGCFWCTEAVFSRLKGVTSVVSGYAGGKGTSPDYEDVSSGETGHAEVVKIEFNPSIISYEVLLDVFWNTHDPTTSNQQGADVGTQYRSVILYTSPQQKRTAEQSLKAFQKKIGKPVVTKVQPFDAFYTAEEYHQKYYDRNEDQPYCSTVISPKIKKLFEKYPDLVKKP